MQIGSIRWLPLLAALLLLVPALAACGGSGDSAATDDPAEEQEQAVAETDDEGQETATETETDSSASIPSGPPPAPGTGTVVLEDGREYAITLSRCDLAEGSDGVGAAGTAGTRPDGSVLVFEFKNDYMNGEWYQVALLLELPSGNEITARATPFREGDAPAVRDGASASWTGNVTEVEIAGETRTTTYTGQATVRITCA